MATDSLEVAGPETRALVEFVSGTSYEDVPDTVIDHAKLVLLDTIGSLLAASNEEYDPGRTLEAFVEETGGHPHSTIVGYGTKTSCPNAALANGTMGYFCDLDAHHPEAITHTPAIMVPASLAAGERESSSGKDLLVAMILGIEVSCRVSLALNPNVLYEQGFHPTPVSGVFGAAVAAGKLLGLDPCQQLVALGLAQNQMSGTLSWKEEPTESFRPFNPGIAARNGVTAAQLASLNFGTPVDPFAGQYNVFRAFSNGRENVEELDRELGESYAITEHAFKRYSSVAFSHTSLDALLGLMEEHDLEADDLREVTVQFPATGAELIDDTELKSHSLRYLLAIAAVEGQVTIDDIITDRSSDPVVSDMIDRIELVPDDALDSLFPERYTSILELETDAASYSERVDYAEGTPEKPFDNSDIEEKFHRIATPTTTEAARSEIVSTILDVENVDDIGRIATLLS